VAKKFEKSAKFTSKQASDLGFHLLLSPQPEGFVPNEGPDLSGKIKASKGARCANH
jgi:hypothetical protein